MLGYIKKYGLEEIQTLITSNEDVAQIMPTEEHPPHMINPREMYIKVVLEDLWINCRTRDTRNFVRAATRFELTWYDTREREGDLGEEVPDHVPVYESESEDNEPPVMIRAVANAHVRLAHREPLRRGVLALWGRGNGRGRGTVDENRQQREHIVASAARRQETYTEDPGFGVL